MTEDQAPNLDVTPAEPAEPAEPAKPKPKRPSGAEYRRRRAERAAATGTASPPAGKDRAPRRTAASKRQDEIAALARAIEQAAGVALVGVMMVSSPRTQGAIAVVDKHTAELAPAIAAVVAKHPALMRYLSAGAGAQEEVALLFAVGSLALDLHAYYQANPAPEPTETTTSTPDTDESRITVATPFTVPVGPTFG